MHNLWVKNFAEIAPSSTVFQIQALLCFAFLKKNSKWPHFWQDRKFLKTGSATQKRHRMGKKFHRAIVFCIFEKNSKIKNGCHFWQVNIC